MKKIIGIGATIGFVLMSSAIVMGAANLPEIDHAGEAVILDVLSEGNNVETVDEHTISPYIHGICMQCGEWCYTVCAAEGEVGDVWYHDTLTTKDCKITTLRSRGASMCGTCSFVNEQYGYHDCWEVHTKCSKGKYDICPMDVS